MHNKNKTLFVRFLDHLFVLMKVADEEQRENRNTNVAKLLQSQTWPDAKIKIILASTLWLTLVNFIALRGEKKKKEIMIVAIILMLMVVMIIRMMRMMMIGDDG